MPYLQDARQNSCSDCWVTQTNEDGGDLGDPFCEAYLHRRLRERVEDFFKSCISYHLGLRRPAKMSRELGVNAPDHDLLSPIDEVMTICEPTGTATADILHVDGQVYSCATVERFIKIYNLYIYIYNAISLGKLSTTTKY